MRAAWLVLLLAACSEAGTTPLTIDAAEDDFPDAAPLPDVIRVDARPQADGPTPDAADPPPRYPPTATLSPITPSVARNLQAIALRGDALKDDVFAKVGDSITVADQFMKCFATAGTDLSGHMAELEGTLDHFKLGNAAGTNPYQRVSLAAKVGASSPWVITGAGSPLESETTAVSPRYAVVMFGSNDVAQTPTFIFTFAPTMLAIVDRLVALGVIPIMSTVPPQTNDTNNERIPRFNEVVRAIAQARQLPLMDYHKELLLIPACGLGGDGLHPNSFPAGACKLTADGLKYGYNLRNLLTLQTLDRVRSVVEGDPPPDPPASAPAVRGEGTYTNPFDINSFPWSDMRDTSLSMSMKIDKYTCMKPMPSAQNEAGPEYVYKLVLASEKTVHAMVFDGDGVDIDLHLMSDTSGGDKCIERNDREIIRTLAAGTYYFILDTFVPAAGTAQAGEYLFLIMADEPADPHLTCPTP